MLKEPEKFYRYEVCDKSAFEEESLVPNFQIALLEFDIIKKTDCGYWIRQGIYGKKHWVSKRSARKKYARETKDKALKCFIHRSNKRIGYLKYSMEKAKKGLALAKKMTK